MVAGHAVWLPRERGPLLSAPPTGTQAGQRGQEDLAEVGRDQVVEDGVDGRADVEESVRQHVEVVVEVEEEPAGGRRVVFRPPKPSVCTYPGMSSMVAWDTKASLGALFLGYLVDLALTTAPLGHGLSTLPPLLSVTHLNCPSSPI